MSALNKINEVVESSSTFQSGEENEEEEEKAMPRIILKRQLAFYGVGCGVVGKRINFDRIHEGIQSGDGTDDKIDKSPPEPEDASPSPGASKGKGTE